MHGRINDGYEHLSGFLSTTPYSDSPSLLAAACLYCFLIASSDQRQFIRGKFFRRAINYFSEYCSRLDNRSPSLFFCRIAINSSMDVRNNEAIALVAKQIAMHPNNIGLLVEMFLAIYDDSSAQQQKTLELITKIIYLCMRTGSSLPFESLMVDFLTNQLRHKQMKTPEFLQYLHSYKAILLLRMLRGHEVDTSMLFDIECIDLQIAAILYLPKENFL